MGYFNIDSINHPGDRVIGDAPADIMSDALNKIVLQYKKDVGRPPYLSELVALVSFSSGHLIEGEEILEDKHLDEATKSHQEAFERLSRAAEISILARIPLSLTAGQVDDIICYIQDLKDYVLIERELVRAWQVAGNSWKDRAFKAEKKLEEQDDGGVILC